MNETNSQENRNNELARAPPRILYHGTVAPWAYDKIRKFNQYTQYNRPIEKSEIPLGKESIWFTGDLLNALGYASQRSKYYKESNNELFPLVLAVDTKKLNFPFVDDPSSWRTYALNLESFLCVNGNDIPVDEIKDYYAFENKINSLLVELSGQSLANGNRELGMTTPNAICYDHLQVYRK